jgi:hypothetical protein
MRFLEPLDDRRRLDQHAAAVVQRRHQALRLQLEIAGAAMCIAAQVDRHDLVGQAFEVQRDAQAVRGTAAEERVELHGNGGSLASAVQSAAPTLSAISPTPSMRPAMSSALSSTT